MSEPVITRHIEPIPFNEDCREELEQLQRAMARMIDETIVQAFRAAAFHGSPGLTRTAARRRSSLDFTSINLAEASMIAAGPPESHFGPYGEPINRPTCAQCGKPNLNMTYTSTRDQREICVGCFDALQDKGLAREHGQPMRKKARHPLDAWMGES